VDVATKLHEKYLKEGRLSFGVAAVELQDGTVQGSVQRPLTIHLKT
jgi:hypothetical protein